MPNILLFDLDGTLIDSAPSILHTFATALARAGIAPVVPLDQSLIGPPLHVTLSRIASIEDADTVEHLANFFREEYDTSGYLKTLVYPSVDETLRSLALSGSTMFIVTNKRIHPTLRILDMLDWTALFAGIYALDSVSPVFTSKSALIRWLLEKHDIPGQDACLIGDTPDDAQAAHENGLQFIGVSWGYGRFSPDVLRDLVVLDNAAAIARLC